MNLIVNDDGRNENVEKKGLIISLVTKNQSNRKNIKRAIKTTNTSDYTTTNSRIRAPDVRRYQFNKRS